MGDNFSAQYRSMIYFVTATLFMYQGDMVFNPEVSISPEDFAKANPSHTQRVFDEAKTCFNYELSGNQMMTGVSAYLKARLRPQKVSETEVFDPKIYNHG